MKKILLSGKLGMGKFIIVNDDDFNTLNKYKWHLSTSGYAQRHLPRRLVNNKIFRPCVQMHREILHAQGRLQYVDHINSNKFDNRRLNLRFASPHQSVCNVLKRKVKNVSSEYKGVSWSKLNEN